MESDEQYIRRLQRNNYLWKAFSIRQNKGYEAMREYCLKHGVRQNEIEAVNYKYELAYKKAERKNHYG